MKIHTLITIAAGGLTAVVIGLASPAAAAPTGPVNAQQTIIALQSQGYKVVVNKLGSDPLEQSTVVAVRPGQTYSRTDSGVPGDNLVTTIIDRTVYVDVS